MKRVPALLAAVALASMFLSTYLTPVHAHETRQVGSYKLTVGWVTEPPLTGERNAVELSVTNSSDKPVAGLQATLIVTLIYGGNTFKPSLEAQEVNGTYAATVVLTRAGTYNVTVSGMIESQPVNEKFELERVLDRSDVEFPTQDPSPTSLQNSASDASGKANTATIIGLTGIATGVVGIAAALLAYRKKTPAPKQ